MLKPSVSVLAGILWITLVCVSTTMDTAMAKQIEPDLVRARFPRRAERADPR